MLELAFRPQAENDLVSIVNYTKAEWGERQARIYIEEIRHKILFAAEFPGIGSSVTGLPSAYRKTAAGSHRVIYRFTEKKLIVVRIIHEREDVFDDPEDAW